MVSWWEARNVAQRWLGAGAVSLVVGVGVGVGVLALGPGGPWCPKALCGVAVESSAARGQVADALDEDLAKLQPAGPGDGCAVVRLPADPAISRPGYLEPIENPMFDTRTIRVTDPGGPVPGLDIVWGDIARHHYSLDQAWNADQTLFMLDRGTRGPLFLDGRTYRPLFRRDSAGETRWHPTEPDLQIFVRGNVVGLWNVRTDQRTTLRQFSEYSDIALGPSKGNLSDDGSMIALAAKSLSGRELAFAYNINSDKKYPEIGFGASQPDYVTISPSGDLIVMHGELDRDVSPRGDATRVFDLEGHQIGPDWPEYGRPSHFDLTIDENGDQVAVGISKSEPDQGRTIKRRLRDGHVESLTTWPGAASHVSARNIRQPGWVYVTFGELPDRKDWLPFAYEVVALRTDGSQVVRRLAPTYAAASGYESEAHASPSPDGSGVVWASNWALPGGPISAFVTEITPGPGCIGIARP